MPPSNSATEADSTWQWFAGHILLDGRRGSLQVILPEIAGEVLDIVRRVVTLIRGLRYLILAGTVVCVII